MNILFMTNVPSPYRVDFFNELGKFCKLTVLFELTTSEERDKSWEEYKFVNFKGVFLKGKTINADTAICFEIRKWLREHSYDIVVCANFTSPTGMLAINYMRKHNINYWLESDGGFAKSGKGFKEKVKKYFISGAQGYLSTGKEHDNYYRTYGAEKSKIYRYPFTSIFEKEILDHVVEGEEKQKIKDKLGIRESKVILAIGRFIYIKGFDLLLQVANVLDPSIGIYFVGGEPTDEYLTLQKKMGLTNVHFVGFQNRENLQEYYQAADLFALPTRGDVWGLVVNEAMAQGLPVITTNKCIAGMELVENGKNGFVVESDDIVELREKIDAVLQDNVALKEMAKCSLKKIKDYTIEKMAWKHLEIFKNYLGLKD